MGGAGECRVRKISAAPPRGLFWLEKGLLGGRVGWFVFVVYVDIAVYAADEFEEIIYCTSLASPRLNRFPPLAVCRE